jgi:Rrf2 family protein
LLQLTKQGDYAIRTILELASRAPDAIVPAREIAECQDIPLPFLNKIVQILAKAGIVITIRGNQGGVKLVPAPEKITLRQVIEVMEGPIALNQCLLGRGVCSRDSFCRVHQVWVEAQETLLSRLEAATFAQLLE